MSFFVGLIAEEEAIMRVNTNQLDQLLHPMIDPKVTHQSVAKGLPASPGAAVGRIVFTAEDAEQWSKLGMSAVVIAEGATGRV